MAANIGAKSTEKTLHQRIGIGVFVLGLALFTAALGLSHYTLEAESLREALNNDYHWSIVEPHLDEWEGKRYGNSFAFVNALDAFMRRMQDEIKQDVRENKGLSTSDREYWNFVLQDYKLKSLRYSVTRASSAGFLPANAGWWLWLALSLSIGGALMYILPQARLLPGIKNNHIYHSAIHHRGWLGIATGVYLIGFYIVLYFYPQHMVNWIILVDPISRALNGGAASQWFLYGFLYTLAIMVMGVRMIIKYRHSQYQIIRTFSVIFFQTAFAFLIPQIMELLNQPSMDLKNIWPLDYSFFFDYRLRELTSSGALGLFMLVWGIALIVVAVPVITYFYGKRWYCSWVCGCGGLAETLGDPYRQLSDKRLGAWQVERYLVHGVLVFAVVMTALVLYTYFSGDSLRVGANRWWLLALIWGLGLALLALNRRWFSFAPQRAMRIAVFAIGGVFTIGLLVEYFGKGGHTVYLGSFQIRQWYGSTSEPDSPGWWARVSIPSWATGCGAALAVRWLPILGWCSASNRAFESQPMAGSASPAAIAACTAKWASTCAGTPNAARMWCGLPAWAAASARRYARAACCAWKIAPPT
jgi:ferredoxin-type protein NapH